MSNLVCCYFKTRARLLFKSLPNSIETLTMQRRWLKNWVWMVVWHVCLYCCPHECVAGDQQKSVWSTLCTVLEDQSGSKEVVWTWVLLLCEPLVLAGGCEVGCEPLVMWSWVMSRKYVPTGMAMLCCAEYNAKTKQGVMELVWRALYQTGLIPRCKIQSVCAVRSETDIRSQRRSWVCEVL